MSCVGPVRHNVLRNREIPMSDKDDLVMAKLEKLEAKLERLEASIERIKASEEELYDRVSDLEETLDNFLEAILSVEDEDFDEEVEED